MLFTSFNELSSTDIHAREGRQPQNFATGSTCLYREPYKGKPFDDCAPNSYWQIYKPT